MDILLLILVFVTSIAVSAAVVYLFSGPIDRVLNRLLGADIAAAWSGYAKFGLFVIGFVGGLRLEQIAAVASPPAPGTARLPVTAAQCVLAIMQSIAGSLSAAAWTLLIFFVAAVVLLWAREFYAVRRMAGPGTDARDRERRPPEPVERR